MNLKRGQKWPWSVSKVWHVSQRFAQSCAQGRTATGQSEAVDELWDAFNTLTLLVPGHLSPRKVLPDSIRIPEEVMAVMLKRKNTVSSCQNTQSAAITASLPGTGTRSYRWLQLDSSVSPLDHLRAPLPLSHGMVLSNESALWRCGTWTPISWKGAQGETNAN